MADERERRAAHARQNRRQRDRGAPGQPAAERSPDEDDRRNDREQRRRQQRRVARAEHEIADAGRAPLAQRPPDQLDERVQRAHVCRAASASACRFRRPNRRHCERRRRLTASCPSASAASSAVPSSAAVRRPQGASSLRLATVTHGGEHAERLTQRIATIPGSCAAVPFSATVLGRHRRRQHRSSCRRDREARGRRASALRSAAYRDQLPCWLTGRDSATAPARRKRRRRAARQLAVPSVRSGSPPATAPSSREAARSAAPGDTVRCRVADDARRLTAARASSITAISAASTNATPASNEQQVRTEQTRRRRRRTCRPACRGCRRRLAGTSDSTRIGTGTSEYCVSRPCSAAPPCSEFCTR